MRGALMRLFTPAQHKQILLDYPDNGNAKVVYSQLGARGVSTQNVAYWRKVFIDHAGNLAATDAVLKDERILRKPAIDDDVGNTAFVPKKAECILVIPDMHAPYQHPDTLQFLLEVKDKFIPDLVICLGDELDYHSMSFHDSDPNLDSAGTELEKAKVFMQYLHSEFPNMLVCHSNHGSMVYRRAKAHGIPVQMIRKYRDVIFPEHGAPGWSWAHEWRVGTPLGDVTFKHQSTNILTDAAHNQCNLVVGHEHGNFDVTYSASSSHLYYGCHSGCLIDRDALAFAYGKHTLRKPMIGCTIILNGKPVLIPMLLTEEGRWAKKL